MLDITQDLKRTMRIFESKYAKLYKGANIGAKLLFFYEVVRNSGPADLKNQSWWVQEKRYMFDGKVVRGDAPDNILYGYLGKAFGFSDQLLLMGAGFAQIRAGTSLPEWQNFRYWGDDPVDQEMIKLGIRVYNEMN